MNLYPILHLCNLPASQKSPSNSESAHSQAEEPSSLVTQVPFLHGLFGVAEMHSSSTTVKTKHDETFYYSFIELLKQSIRHIQM